MILLYELGSTELIITLIMAYLAAVLFLFSGLNLVINKNQKSISKKAIFRNPEKLTLVLGVMELACSAVVLIMATLAIFLDNKIIYMFVSAGTIIIEILTEVILQKKFRERRIK